MIKVYSKPNCAQCDMTKRALDGHGLKYDAIDVTQDPAAALHLADLGYRQVPVVEAGDEHWGGFRPDRIAALAA